MPYLETMPPAPTLAHVSLNLALFWRLARASVELYYWVGMLLFSLLAIADSPLYLLAHLVDFCEFFDQERVACQSLHVYMFM
jgi:hypothetical protein